MQFTAILAAAAAMAVAVAASPVQAESSPLVARDTCIAYGQPCVPTSIKADDPCCDPDNYFCYPTSEGGADGGLCVHDYQK